MNPLGIVFAVLGVLAVWGAIVAGAVRFYVNSQIKTASLRAELSIRESLQANTDAINRTWAAIATMEGTVTDIGGRVDRLSKRIGELSTRINGLLK